MDNWKSLIPGVIIGNVLTLYDFTLYGFLATKIGQAFFIKSNPHTALMIGFFVFASACIVRPAGSFLFGYIGDRFGRRILLLWSLSIMSVATIAIALLPTYQTIGIFASITLLFFRLLQGLSMSGEETGSAVFLIESAPKQSKAFAGSIILASVHLGLLLGATVIFFLNVFLTSAQAHAWGWRIPFALAFPLAMLGIYLRSKQNESKEFQTLKHQKQIVKNPFKELAQQHKYSLMSGFFAASILAVSIYLYAVFLPNFIKINFDYSMEMTSLFFIASFTISAMVVLIAGYYSDRFNLKLPLLISSFLFAFCPALIFFLLDFKSFSLLLLAQLLLIIQIAFSSASLMGFMARLFPTRIRASGIGLSFNLSMLVFGSTAPIVVLSILSNSALYHYLILYFACLGLLSFLFVAKRTYSQYTAQTEVSYGS